MQSALRFAMKWFVAISIHSPIIESVLARFDRSPIGKSLMASDQWRTFTDFLIAYAISVFGDAWGQAEQRKDPTLRHPVVRWYDKLYASVSAGHKSDDKNVSVWYRPTALRWRFFIWPMTYTCLLIMNPFRRNLSRG